jgi:hypothetical protein
MCDFVSEGEEPEVKQGQLRKAAETCRIPYHEMYADDRLPERTSASSIKHVCQSTDRVQRGG